GCERDYKIHLGREANVVAGFAARRGDADSSCHAIDRNVHENLERYWDAIAAYAVGRQHTLEISLASMMRLGVPIDDAEGVRRARGQREVVTAYGVLDNAQHWPATVRIDDIAD